MRVLLDEDVPLPALSLLRHILRAHQVDHVQGIGWSGKKDTQLLVDASRAGYDAIVTNDRSQLDDPDETAAIKASGLHHVRYGQRQQGLRGLALAVGAVVAALPGVIEALEGEDGQRLVSIKGLDPTPRTRFTLVNPRRDPPRYWPR